MITLEALVPLALAGIVAVIVIALALLIIFCIERF